MGYLKVLTASYMGIDMKIYYLQNENKEIIQDDFERFDDNCLEIDKDDYHIVNGYNGALFLTEYTKTDEYMQKAEKFRRDTEIIELRRRRMVECFAIVNRGAVWYERLTKEQRQELEIWYQAWLDVTDTKVIPTNPIWLE